MVIFSILILVFQIGINGFGSGFARTHGGNYGCGTGNGINMSVNHHKGIRGALCWQAEIAELARQHNDANILVMPGRFISEEEALKCVTAFLDTPFEGGRHIARIEAIPVK